MMTLSSKLRDFCEFPGSPVVKNLPSNADGAGLNPGQGGNNIPPAWPCSQPNPAKLHKCLQYK